MRKVTLSLMVLLLAGGALYGIAELPSGNEVDTTLQPAPMACAAAGWTLPEESADDLAIVQMINPCLADCREDYGACLISTPQYICRALYQVCLEACG